MDDGGGWNWKGKDGGRGGLLYEPGNWGDILKLLWLKCLLEWKSAGGCGYFDPFAGDVGYPLGERTRRRLEQCARPDFAFLREPFLDRGVWPSAASAARRLARGDVEVWDADPGRRGNWSREAGVRVLSGDCGWRLMAARRADAGEAWLLDPYDFLAGWRGQIGALAEKSRDASILLYVYNRSAGDANAFREYRACRGALESARGDLPKRVGRAAADAFLPRAHHEMWFLPCRADCAAPGLDGLFRRLAAAARRLDRAIRRAGVCEA